MIKRKYRNIAFLTFIADILIAVISFYVSYWLRDKWFTSFQGLMPIRNYQWMLFFIIPFWSLALYYSGTYNFSNAASLKKLLRVWLAIVIGIVCLTSVIFIFKLLYLSRLFLLIFSSVNLFLATLGRSVISLFLSHYRRSPGNIKNILIVGEGESAKNFSRIIQKHDKWGLNFLGFVSENPGGREANDSRRHDDKVIGSISDIQELIHRYIVDEVIFAISRQKMESLQDVLLLLEDEGVNARIVLNIFPHMIAKIHLDELDNVPLLTFTTLPTNEFALFLKRFFDIFISLVTILIFSPFAAIIAILIKLTSPGPVIFVQKRCGLNGRVFNFYKFRSMYEGAELKKAELESSNEMDGPVFKIKGDPRITTIGLFLRRTSLDELPQIWNVLKGDMSIVGPRPPTPTEVDQYERWQRRKLSMRPGLTCIWQISGRNLIRFQEWIKLDLQYIDNWSLWLDIKILLRTIPAILSGKGAY